MRNVSYQTDLCVVGGGMSGLCAAVAAARHGAKVVLMQDRPVLGGNASSEVRMHICGAHGENNRETGLLEEICLDNLHRNPSASFAIWDSVLYEKAVCEPNITLLLNCVMLEVVTDGTRIDTVKGYQLTNETHITVQAALFADCTGDATLAYLAGAETCIGRESRDAFGETIPPDIADSKTMGQSCLIQIRETDRYQTFTPPVWANVYETDDAFPHEYRNHMPGNNNYWWIELGGDGDILHSAEELRHELLKIAFGVWDHVKNRGDHNADNWALEWVGFLPGKRESRRCVGDHMLTQLDLEAGGIFPDTVAYGGWTMDDHHPEGFHYPGPPTIFHPCPSPYGIPYRSLYSKNIDNLFFAGRNISATHAALSSTRVMATCALMGQAVGTAAAVATQENCNPRGVLSHIDTLQARLQQDDCFLPNIPRQLPQSVPTAAFTASENPQQLALLQDGHERGDYAWYGGVGAWVGCRWQVPMLTSGVRLVFDSNLNRAGHNMPCYYPLHMAPLTPPYTLPKRFRLEWEDTTGRHMQEFDNHQRLVRIPLAAPGGIMAMRLTILETWGAGKAGVYGFEAEV